VGRPGPPHYRGFAITLRHKTLGRIPLYEWSARRRDLYLTTNTTHKKQTSMLLAGFETEIPARAADPRLRPRGHWDQHSDRTGPWNRSHDDVLPSCYSTSIMPVPCRSILQASAGVTAVLHKLVNQPSSLSVQWLDILKVVTPKTEVLWTVTPCILVEVYGHFTVSFCLHNRICGQQVSVTSRYVSTRLHGVTPRQRAIFGVTQTVDFMLVNRQHTDLTWWVRLPFQWRFIVL
jgi:hypothetical protein